MSRYIDVADITKQIADFKKAVNSPNSDYMTGYLSALSVTEGMIANTPTADVVEVRHGKWRVEDTGKEGVNRPILDDPQTWTTYKIFLPVCSRCKKMFGKLALEYNYCPHCGAKMDGERSENGT